MSKRKMVAGALLYSCCAAYYLVYFNCGISLTDEGIFVNSSLRILAGQIPYIDFQYYPPALNYMLAGVFKVFGVDLLYERLLWVAVISLSILMTSVLSRKIMAFPFLVFPPLLFLVVPGPWHKSMIPFLFLSAALAGGGYINDKSRRRAFYCGLMGGGALYFRLDTSGFIIAAFLMLIVAANFLASRGERGDARSWLEETSGLLAGVLLVILPALVFFGYLESESGYFSYILDRILGERGTMGLPFPAFDPALALVDFKLWARNAMYYVPVAVFAGVSAVLAYRYFKRGLDKDDLLLLLLLFLGICSFNQTLVRADWAHLLQSVHIAYILGPYLAWVAYRRLGGMEPGAAARALKGGIAVICLAVMSLYVYTFVGIDHLYTGTIGIMRHREAKLDIPGAGLYMKSARAEEIEGMVNYITSHTGIREPIVVLPYAPMFYVLSGRENPTRFDGVFPGTFTDAAMQASFIESIKKSGPELIVYQDTQFTDKEESRFENYARPLYDYIMQNYVLSARFGEYQVLLRK